MKYEFDLSTARIENGVLSIEGGPVPTPAPPAPTPPVAAKIGKVIKAADGVEARLIDAGGVYELTEDLTFERSGIFVSTKDPVTIKLNGFQITYNTSGAPGCAGVAPWRSFSAQGVGSDDATFKGSLTPVWGNAVVLIEGPGRIVAGAPGEYAVAVGAGYPTPVHIDDSHLHASGPDAGTIFGGAVSLFDSVCHVESNSTSNRHAAPANVKASGSCLAENNVLIGGNSGFAVGDGSGVFDNFIRHDAFATNGYGVFLYKTKDVEVRDNLIFPSNGRGILYNGPSASEANGGGLVAAHNIILAMERPNDEFGTNLEPTCYRLRYHAENAKFTNNTCLAIGGEGLTSAMGAYLTDSGKGNSVVDNDLMAVLIGPVDLPKNRVAAALGLIGHGQLEAENKGRAAWQATTEIRANRLWTNCAMVCGSHSDGGCDTVPIDAKWVEWMSGNRIISGWFSRASQWIENHPFARDYFDTDSIPVVTSDPDTRYRTYAGRYLGSRAQINVGVEIGGPAEDTLWHSRNYGYDVTWGGRKLEK